MKENNLMDKIVSLCKRRGFVFPSAEIYGGLSGFYDYGPLGAEMIKNIKDLWWQRMIRERENVYPVQTRLVTKREVLQASGHEKSFVDPMADCKKCKMRFRADHLENQKKCPECGAELTEARPFNMMFKTFVGPVDDEKNLAYLRPETAQGMFTNYENIMETWRAKLPFGIAQIGSAFRNEITPGNFLFRAREFEQGEVEFFVEPKEADQWFDYWVEKWQNFCLEIGLSEDKLHLREHSKKELSHYSATTTDIEYDYPFGRSELAGIANRTNYDLKQHGFNEPLPYIIEPTIGFDRLMLALLCNAYDEVKGGRTTTTESAKETETVLHLNPKISPVKATVLPLVNKDSLPELARGICDGLRTKWNIQYDGSGTIGRRYRRQDEIGTPFCITVDFQSVNDQTITIRNRDTMKQERVKIREIETIISNNLKQNEN